MQDLFSQTQETRKNPQDLTDGSSPPATPRWIAEVMGQVILRHLVPAAARMQPSLEAITIRCRTGSGRATYCRQEPGGYSITFGTGMIGDKLAPGNSLGWLTTREVLERGYYDGRVNTLNLLSHTLCHEFAHILQALSLRGRVRQRTHDRHFYRELDQLHHSGLGGIVRDRLAQQLRLRLPPARLEQLVETGTARPPIGAIVRFEIGDEILRGVVIKHNRYTMTVEVRRGRSGSQWRVPWHAVVPDPG